MRWPLIGAALVCLGCGQETAPEPVGAALEFPGVGAGKFDVFGNALSGIAAPYSADASLGQSEDLMRSDMGARRAMAWAIAARTLDSVPLLGLADAPTDKVELPNGEVPTVPRWQTWYGVDDFKRMLRHLLEGLTPVERAQRKPFTAEAIVEAEEWNSTALDRSERWPLERFFKHVNKLGVCDDSLTDDQCAQTLQSNFSGATGGNARIAYSPATIRHLLANYGPLLDCLDTLKTLGFDAEPVSDENFTFCLDAEFPIDAVLIKAHWVRSDFGRKLPVFDTDAKGLARVIGDDKLGNWATGDREADPTADEVFTIRLRNGDTYRLAGLHIMTRELRHWTWITMWWSDTPDSDFGADRPASFAALDPVWSRYKMAIVVDYEEHDSDPARHFEDPTLAAALTASNFGGLTWNSNPYIEHGNGNAKTNCIGCHQHGGSAMGPDLDGDGDLDPFDLELVIANEGLFPQVGRSQIRSVFPADYLWSTKRVDDLGDVIRSEVARADQFDADDPEVRAVKILALTPDTTAGEATFVEKCADCHGKDGTGTVSGPSLYDRLPKLTDDAFVVTLIEGLNSTMPSWGHLEDQTLANVRAYAREHFGQGETP